MHSNLILVLIIQVLGAVKGVTIVSLDVPKVIKANTSAVVLDCDYDINEWETGGFVLKWYVDGVHLVYQWIPPLAPQALGVLSGRVNTSYTASSAPWKAHRAIYIPYPDPNLSGRYSCTVSTFEDEDTRSANMLVWTPAEHVDLKYWRPSEHLVNITCFASAISPEPAFTLYTQPPDGNRTEVFIRGTSNTLRDGLYWSGAWGLIVWAETPEDTVIGCTLWLNGTRYVHTKNQVYNPDLPIITTTTTTTTTTEATTTSISRHDRPASDMSHSVPNATNRFFDLSNLFGPANGGNSLLLVPTVSNFSLMCILCTLHMFFVHV